MTTQTMFGHRVSSRAVLYTALALLVLIPVAAFAIGPLTSSSFSLKGPAGPLLAFSAGLLSFVSPCVLPMVPIYLAHISGAGIEEGRITASRRVTFTHSLVFVAAFSFVFIAIGSAAGLLGFYFLQDNKRDLTEWAGVVLVLMGVLLIPSSGRRDPLKSAVALLILTAVFFFLANVARLHEDRVRLIMLAVVLVALWLRYAGYLEIPFLSRTFETGLGKNHGVGYTRSALFGGAFALGWTPCIGPILASIITLAADSSSALRGTYLLAAYSAGLAIPFLIGGLAISDLMPAIRKIQRHTGVIELASGIMLVGVGVLLITGNLTGLNQYFDFASFNGGL
ncbi:sulfite exporter TauE/SafE family protein [bacterium]|jgi:cytochrome c-type biogenesis protein|nr:sulfite exporter TauE/SafE family protein [bacterium]